MTSSQFKKHKAHLFNVRRAERLAYEMDKVLFPKPGTRRISGTSARLLALGLFGQTRAGAEDLKSLTVELRK